MKNQKTVSEAYLNGIRDERKSLQADLEEFTKDPLGFAREMLESVERTMRQGFSGEMLEYMRGGRDFWRNQVRKHSR